ncbi:hypothetical protein C8R43DRAFT_948739 [Mycena crocata]|nr:hypothetical protein C8R43DRAFT_948739 [Mycena crocata]
MRWRQANMPEGQIIPSCSLNAKRLLPRNPDFLLLKAPQRKKLLGPNVAPHFQFGTSYSSTPGAVAQRQEHRLLYVSSSREQKKAAGGQYIAPSAKARLLPPRSGGNIDYYIKKSAGGQHTASIASGRIMTRTSGAKRHINPPDSHPAGFDTTYRNPASGIKNLSTLSSIRTPIYLLVHLRAPGVLARIRSRIEPWRARELACDLRAGRILGDFFLPGPLLALSKIPLTFCRASRRVFGAVIYQETWAARFQLARSTNAWVHGHGFFVSIGGFVSLDGHPVATKTRLEHPLAGPEYVSATSAGYPGRSKENTISKAVALTQAMWFIALTTMNIIREVNRGN